MKPQLHVVGLPWTETTPEYSTCAYTQKIVKFGRMMTDAGYSVIIYSGEENEAVCAEHVPCITKEQRLEWFGEHDPNTVWQGITWDPSHPSWQELNGKAGVEIKNRAQPFDLVLLSAGQSMVPICNLVPELTSCEPFVGYKGIIGENVFCAFESHAWRHHVYGLRNAFDPKWDDGRWYDEVIPNFFDPADFEFTAEPEGCEFVEGEPEDYLLFLGRVTQRKNPHIATRIADELDMKIIVAGPGVSGVMPPSNRQERRRGIYRPRTVVGDQVQLLGEHIEYVGVADIEARRRLLANAKVIIAPTQFLEPFGGVAVEAMLSGTPAVTSNWGAFTETVKEGVSGYRFRTLYEGVEATRKAMELDRQAVRDYAESRYTLDAVAPQFDAWFQRLVGLKLGGWDSMPVQVEAVEFETAEA